MTGDAMRLSVCADNPAGWAQLSASISVSFPSKRKTIFSWHFWEYEFGSFYRATFLPRLKCMRDWITTGLPHLQFGKSFNGFERPQDSEHPQGLDGVDVLAFCPSAQTKSTVTQTDIVKKELMINQHFRPPIRGADCSTGNILVEMFLPC